MERKDRRLNDTLLVCMCAGVLFYLVMFDPPAPVVIHSHMTNSIEDRKHEMEMRRQFAALAHEAEMTRDLLSGAIIPNPEARLRAMEERIRALEPDEDSTSPPP